MFGAKLGCCLLICVWFLWTLFEVKTGHAWPSQLCIWVSTTLNLQGWGLWHCMCLITLAGVSQLLRWFSLWKVSFDYFNDLWLFSPHVLCLPPSFFHTELMGGEKKEVLYACPIFSGFTAHGAAVSVHSSTVHRFVWELGRCHLFFSMWKSPAPQALLGNAMTHS